MKWLLCVFVLFVLYESIICPPVDKKKTKEEDKDANKEAEGDDLGLEYERYLKEVVNVLEQDETFRKRLEESNSSEIRVQQLSYDRYLKEVFTVLTEDETIRKRLEKIVDIKKESGDIAQHLDFVHHNVRTKLDELKRKEVDRLKLLSKIKHGRTNGMKIVDPEIAKHVDHSNHDTFEVKDLENLIKRATEDLEDLDQKRRKEFKEYELEKEVEHREKLKHMDEKARAEEEKRWNELKEKHKKHPKLHHPGSKDQLEEVWEEKDHMDKESFDPKTFFYKHDINGDGELDAEEVEALFEAELAKVYDEDAEEDDLVEREEERNRMREHVFSEVDKDKDGMISLKEFLSSTDQKEFNEDQGWKTLDEDPVYTDDELEEYEKEFLAEQEKERQQWQDQQPGVVQHPANPSQIPPIQDHMAQQGQGQINQMNQGQPPHAQAQGQPPIPQGGQQFQQPPHPQAGQPAHPQGGQFQQPPHPQGQQFQQPPHPQGGQQFQQPPHKQGGQHQPGQQQDQIVQGQPGQAQEHPNVQHIQQDPNIQQHNPNVQQHNPNVQQHDPNVQQHDLNVQQHDPNVKQHDANAVPQHQ